MLTFQKIITALGEVMGRPLTQDEATYFHNLVGWEDDEWIDFRTWAGICALCERLLGILFCDDNILLFVLIIYTF